MKTSIETWNDINWKLVHKTVLKLQIQIFHCSKRNDKVRMQNAQRVLINLPQAKYLAVRKVTQDNRGKSTSGVDNIKLLNPLQRLKLAQSLSVDGKADPIRRVYIPKPKTDKMRPLGIPTIKDRAKQTLVRFALEPEWEAKFEPNSYGFRTGRSCHDAMEAVFASINKKDKFVLDADISKCFDHINHEALLGKLETFKKLERQVKAWLKAGVLDSSISDQIETTERGTPQGGTISPLLANVALHGLENMLKDWVETLPLKERDGRPMSRRRKRDQLSVIRYADDFVVLHPLLRVIELALERIAEWLKPMGLELSEDKTRITHTHLWWNGQKPGVNFLGFIVSQPLVGRFKRGRMGLTFKTIIRPTREKQLLHLEKLREILKQHSKTEAIIVKSHPVIQGWTNYYKSVASKRNFNKCDRIMMRQIMFWAYRKHPNRSKKWVVQKYLKRVENRLRFGFYKTLGKNDHQFLYVKSHSEVRIKRHAKVSGERSPFDGDWIYWGLRGQKDYRHNDKQLTLLRRQKGHCAWCGLVILPSDVIEIDHRIPRSRDGKNQLSNMQLLHGHCHDEKSRTD